MSILINYVGGKFSQLAFVIQDHTQALAVDGLDFIFNSLCEATFRLAAKLTRASEAKGEVLGQVKARLIMVDVWNLIDNVHRASELLKHLDYPFEEADNILIREIELIRNSYQHLYDRIDEHFVPKSGSVFGDLSWYHRLNKGDGLWQSLIVSGVTLKEENGEVGRSINMGGNSGDKGLPGIFKVELRYVIKPRKRDESQEITVNLDLAATLINNIITRLENTAIATIEDLEQQQKEKPGTVIGYGLPPAVMHIPIGPEST